MADLTDLQAAITAKIAGANSSGVESNFIDSTPNGALHTNLRNNSGVEITSSATSVPGNQILHAQSPDSFTASTALGALNATVSLAVNGLNSVGFQLAAGTLIGTIKPQASIDGGTTWLDVQFFDFANSSNVSSITFSASNTLKILSINTISGSSHIRVIVSAYTSGTANAILRASQITGTSTITAVSAPQAYNMFAVAQQINMATASTDNPLLLLRNPNASGVRIMVWQLYTGVNINNVSTLFKVFSSPTITTNGTAQTAQLRKVGQSYSASGLPTTLPTVSASGNQLHVFSFGQNSNTDSIISDFSIMIEPNNSIMVTGSPSSNNREAVVTIIWAEIPI